MVGHTHDDIDQMFGRFSTKLAAAPHIVFIYFYFFLTSCASIHGSFEIWI